jgi:hypothetical protein
VRGYRLHRQQWLVPKSSVAAANLRSELVAFELRVANLKVDQGHYLHHRPVGANIGDVCWAASESLSLLQKRIQKRTSEAAPPS